jgi:tetratricopeptide (TPR) repeat protein
MVWVGVPQIVRCSQLFLTDRVSGLRSSARMRCPSCGEDNPQGALICGMCKALLGRVSQPRPAPPVAVEERAWRTTALLIGGISALAIAAVVVARVRHRARAARAPLAAAPAAPAIARPSGPAFKGIVRRARNSDDAIEGVPPTVTNASIWYEGNDGYASARKAAESMRAPLFVYFHGNGCQECARFESEVLAKPAVQELLDGTLKVRVDASVGANELALANSFAVAGYPSLHLLWAPTRPPLKVPGFAREGSKPIMLSVEGLVAALKQVQLPGTRAAIVDGARKALAGDYGDARKELTGAIEADPRSAEALYWRGWAAARDADSKRAIDDLKLATAIDPAFAFSYAELARVHAEGGHIKEAISTLDRLIAVAPGWNQSAAFVARGQMYARMGDRERATADLRQACQNGNPQGCQAAAR